MSTAQLTLGSNMTAFQQEAHEEKTLSRLWLARNGYRQVSDSLFGNGWVREGLGEGEALIEYGNFGWSFAKPEGSHYAMANERFRNADKSPIPRFERRYHSPERAAVDAGWLECATDHSTMQRRVVILSEEEVRDQHDWLTSVGFQCSVDGIMSPTWEHPSLPNGLLRELHDGWKAEYAGTCICRSHLFPFVDPRAAVVQMKPVIQSKLRSLQTQLSQEHAWLSSIHTW